MRILVTGGPTREYFDRVRFISNPSSGRMGDALALEARARGHDVILVRGPCAAPAPEGIRTVGVETTEEMRHACLEAFPLVDAVIMAAAPCDYRPSERLPGKPKKLAAGEHVTVSLTRTPDILLELGRLRRPGQRLVGFAVEVDDAERSALEKLERKRLDRIVLNSPESFARDEGLRAVILGREGRLEELCGTKRDIARGVVSALEGLF